MEQLESALGDALSSVAQFLPKLVGFLVILLIGYLIAKALRTVVDKVLERVGFDKAVERGGIRAALQKSKYDASDMVAKVVYYAAMLFTLQLAFGVFGDNPISELIQGMIAYLPNVVVAIVLVVIAAAVAQAVKGIVETALGGLSYGKALATGASVAILAIGVFAALDQLQIAPNIVNGIFYAILAVIAGSAIVAIGGSGIQPLRSRWEQALQKGDEKRQEVQQEASSGGSPAATVPQAPGVVPPGTPPPPAAGTGDTIQLPDPATTRPY
jgi:hypothetical protein